MFCNVNLVTINVEKTTYMKNMAIRRVLKLITVTVLMNILLVILQHFLGNNKS